MRTDHFFYHIYEDFFKWFIWRLVFSTLHCRAFSFFLFSIFFSSRAQKKKHKSANKRTSYYFPPRCFLSAFFIFVCLFAFLCFCLVAFLCFFVLFGAFRCFWYFLCFLVRAKSFCEKQ